LPNLGEELAVHAGAEIGIAEQFVGAVGLGAGWVGADDSLEVLATGGELQGGELRRPDAEICGARSTGFLPKLEDLMGFGKGAAVLGAGDGGYCEA
jgi:hypothetical protein